MKKIKLILTPRQIDLITSALFEYSDLCDGEADLRDGSRSPGLNKLAKDLDAVRASVERQLQNAIKKSVQNG